MKRILQIVPRVPPAVCGIGDYAWLLARALCKEHDIHSRFLAAGTTWMQPDAETEFPVTRLHDRTAQALVDWVANQRNEVDAVVLHMSLYGYQKRGVPLWLAQGWRRLSQMRGAPRLITMFHELYASGSPRTSAFWLQPLQKHVLRVVAHGSDALRTNRQAYANGIRRLCGSGGMEIQSMPVFSNMHEAAATDPESPERWEGMAVFASTFDQAQRDAFLKTCHSLRIRRIGWIGRSTPPPIGKGLTVHQMPHLASQESRAWFLAHGYAWTSYNPAFLAKSGIFAAFAAHRIAVVLPEARGVLEDGLVEGVHYSTPVSVLVSGSRGLSQSLHSWYLPHNITATAASYALQITEKTAGESP